MHLSRLILRQTSTRLNTVNRITSSRLISSSNNYRNNVLNTHHPISIRRTNARFLSDTNVYSTPSPPTSTHPHPNTNKENDTLIYTETDEAPALATFSLLPIISKVGLYILKELA